jgi:hypothetical protein
MWRIVGVLMACMLPAAAQAGCDAPTGVYTGTPKTSEGTAAEATLNIYCKGGSAAAQLFTSMGDFEVKDVQTNGGHVKVRFDSGASLGTLELDAKADHLSGTVEMAGDHGTAAFIRKGEAMAEDAWKPRLDLTRAQWHEDLRFLATELPKRHANAFFHLSRRKFESEVAELDRRIPQLNGDAAFVGMQQIVKSIGDGHTGVVAPADRRVMPLEIHRFGKEFRVTAAAPPYEKSIGARVMKIAGVPISDAWRRVLTLTPQTELMQLRESDALVYLARGYALHGLGITSDRNHTLYGLEQDSPTFDLDVAGLKPGEAVKLKSGYSDAALRFQKPDEPFRCHALAAAHALYCAWRAYQNLAANAKEMFAAFDSHHARKLILDMRDNGGGDNTIGNAEIVKPLKARSDINRKGRLYVLIGAETFSAAMNNAAQLQDETNAVLVGETIGEKPNSYQEPRQFRLPNSHLVVRASTLYYTFRKHGPNKVVPDKEIIPQWNDFKNGRDPVLDWVLAQPVAGSQALSSGAAAK